MRASCKVVIGNGTNCTYPSRILTDLEAARRRSHEAVMRVRRFSPTSFCCCWSADPANKDEDDDDDDEDEDDDNDGALLEVAPMGKSSGESSTPPSDTIVTSGRRK